MTDRDDTTDWPELLHLGCGGDYIKGACNADVNPAVDPDILLDVSERPWEPFPDDAFNRIEAHHVVEHLEDPAAFFAEAARVLTSNGELVITIPIGINARTDNDHAHEWTWKTPEQYSREHQRPWDPETSFVLQKREVDVWHEGPLERATPILHRIIKKFGPGQWLSQWPATSGEVTAVYRKIE